MDKMEILSYTIKVIKKLLLYVFLCIPTLFIAQIGIGTLHPTAQLEIETQPAGNAALALQPQTHPVGTQTGQLAVINELLFLFDGDRNKWLSVEHTVLEFGRLGFGSEPSEVEFGGGDLQNGPVMPFNVTITSVSISATQNPNDRDITLYVNGSPIANNSIDTTVDGVFNLDPSKLKFINTAYNYDFNEGDEITLKVDNTINDITNLIVNLVVKWRVDNP